MRVYISGLLLVCSVFLMSAHKTVSINAIGRMHPFSNIEYEVASYWLQMYLYTIPVVYLLIQTVIKPKFYTIFKVDLMHVYLFSSSVMLLDNILFFDWTFFDVTIFGVTLILLTVIYMAEYYLQERAKEYIQ